jgi:AraC-like DNA-binding protein
MPPTPRTLDAAIAHLHALIGEPVAARSAIVRAVLPGVQSRRDPLADAETTLLQATARMYEPPGPDDAAQLMHAIRVFEVNERPCRLALAWRLLAGVQAATGDLDAALTSAYHALCLPELRLDGRLGLVGIVLPALALRGEPDLATLVLGRDFLPFIQACRPSRLAALAWVHVAGLHTVLACRGLQAGSLWATRVGDTPARFNPLAGIRPSSDADRARAALARSLGLPAPPAAALPPVGALLDMLHAEDAPPPARATPDTATDSPPDALLAAWTGYLLACAHLRHGRTAPAADALAPTLALARQHGQAALLAACHADLPALLGPRPEGGSALPSPDIGRLWHAGPDPSSGYRPITANASVGEVMHWRRTMPPYVRRALREATATLDSRLSLSEMAERAGVRPRTLQAGLRIYRDVTFLGAYRDAAMSEAIRLLQRTSLPIAEIAVRVGYGSSAAFSRDFRCVHGVPPSALRGRGVG